MVKKKDMLNFLEWLMGDIGCKPKDKLPWWAKTSIEEQIKEIKNG